MDNNKLYSKKDVRNMLRAENLHFKKSLGQNFLTDENILMEISEAASLTNDDYVLEIGPGPGVLTRVLAQQAKKVVAVELDTDIISLLEKNLSDFSNVEIINKDILKIDLNEIFETRFDKKPFKVIANLPYYITTPIIMKLLESALPIKDIVVMVQKEVAQRLCAEPGKKEYGAISLSVSYRAETSIVCMVPPDAFVPEPKVWSSVLKLSMRKQPPVSVNDENYMFSLIKAAFSQRRKTFVNAVSSPGGLGIPKEELKSALSEMGFGDNLRGETLSLVQFAQISDYLQKKFG